MKFLRRGEGVTNRRLPSRQGPYGRLRGGWLCLTQDEERTRLRRFSGRVPRPQTTPRRRRRAAGAVVLIASITGTRRRPRSITERWPRLPRRRTRRVDVRRQRHRSNARETACRQAAGGPWAPRLHSDPKTAEPAPARSCGARGVATTTRRGAARGKAHGSPGQRSGSPSHNRDADSGRDRNSPRPRRPVARTAQAQR